MSRQAVLAGVAVADGPLDPATQTYPGFLKDAYPMTDEVREVLAKPPPEPPLCTVDGEPVDELAVLIKPVAFLVTVENGTHEVGRCYFHGGKFTYGVDLQRLGGIGTESVEYQPDRGLTIHFQRGYEMFIPMSHCQATWRRGS